MSDYLLEVQGVPPGRKGEGVTWLIYENLNGLQSTLSSKNEKLEKAWRVIDDLQAESGLLQWTSTESTASGHQNGFR